jgi:hypothetical protein
MVVVSSVEPMVAAETRELCRRLREEVGRQPTLVVANRVPRRPDPTGVEALGRIAVSGSNWQALQRIVTEDLERVKLADEALDTLAAIAASPLVSIPELFSDPAPSELAKFLGFAP